jgi:hypothetical protein
MLVSHHYKLGVLIIYSIRRLHTILSFDHLLAKWVYRLVLYNESKHNILALICKANKKLRSLQD